MCGHDIKATCKATVSCKCDKDDSVEEEVTSDTHKVVSGTRGGR